MSMSLCPCLHVHVSMSISPCSCLRVHVSVSMSPYPCLCVMSLCPCLFVSISMSPCLHVHISIIHVSMSISPLSMSPCLHVSIIHVSMSSCLHCPCLHVSVSPCFHVFISPCLHVSCPCLHVSLSPCHLITLSLCPIVHVSMFPEFCIRKIGLTENGNFCLFAPNKKWKWQTSVCLLQTEMENGSVFSLVGKLLTFIGDCCFNKLAHLCLPHCPLVSLVNQYPPCCPNVPLLYCPSQCLNGSWIFPPHHCLNAQLFCCLADHFLMALPSFCHTASLSTTSLLHSLAFPEHHCFTVPPAEVSNVT